MSNSASGRREPAFRVIVGSGPAPDFDREAEAATLQDVLDLLMYELNRVNYTYRNQIEDSLRENDEDLALVVETFANIGSAYHEYAEGLESMRHEEGEEYE